MSSLVEELQRDALDGDVDISDLLRKAYAVAVKLKLDKFKEWCDCELNGYKGNVPNYRVMAGTLLALNPINGWIPVFFTEDAKAGELLSVYRDKAPVAAIQDLLNSDNEGREFQVDLPPKLQNRLMEDSGMPFRVSLHIGRSSLVKVVDAVRNTILDWSLRLEADGILGEGMSFSPQERRTASEHAERLQAAVINIGTMVNSSIQQGSAAARMSHR